MAASRRLLLVHAHPDDETITTGATIAHYLGQGAEVSVVTCTLGEEGEVTTPDLAGLVAAQADQLGGYRVWELRAALAALGGPQHQFLGGLGRYRDSGMAGEPANRHPRAFARLLAEPDRLAETAGYLVAAIDQFRPQVVVTYPPDGGYGHPDHIAARVLTLAAVAKAAVPVAAVFETVLPRRRAEAGHAASLRAAPQLAQVGMRPAAAASDWAYVVADEQVDVRIDAGRYFDAKLAALSAHASQERVALPFFALTNGIALAVDAVEHYRRVQRTTVSAVAQDLFDGIDW